MRVMTDLRERCGSKARTAAFTLAEVMVSLLIIVLVYGAIISAYLQCSYRAYWSGYSLAAQAAAAQQLEAAKAAVWDIQQTPVMDQICQLTNPTVVLLNLPVSGTNMVYATNYTIITLITSGIYSNYLVTVNTAWPFRWKNQTTCYTNTVADYFAPE
jgi:Tfp pilus assembly protein PilV